MDEKMKRLHEAELDIMLTVWNEDAPVSSAYILEQLKGKRKWALSTLMTVLTRLTDKGFLVCEKQGWNNLYHAVIGEDDYKENEGKSILKKLYGNSFHNLVTSLYNGKAISKDDLTELQRFLDHVEREG